MTKGETQLALAAGTLAVSAAILTVLFWPKKASASSGGGGVPYDPESKKRAPDSGTSYPTPGVTVLPKTGKQAAPDPWTPVQFESKKWPEWWPSEYQPW